MTPRSRVKMTTKRGRSPPLQHAPMPVDCTHDVAEEGSITDAKRLRGEHGSAGASGSNQHLTVFRQPQGLVEGGRKPVSFNELSFCSPADVFPHLDLKDIRTKGHVVFDGRLFSPGDSHAGKFTVDISVEALRKIVTFPLIEECTRIVLPSVVQEEFLKQTGYKNVGAAFDLFSQWFRYDLKKARNEGWFIENFSRFSLEGRPHGEILDNRCRFVIRQALKIIGRSPNTGYCSQTLVLLAMAHVDPELPHLRPDWHIFLHNEIVRALTLTKSDRTSVAKFREGWAALVDIIKFNVESNDPGAGAANHLLLEDGKHKRNAFDDTRARWDAEKGSLVREREELKRELQKVQAEAEAANKESEGLRQQKIRLQEDFEQQKHDWEESERKLNIEMAELHACKLKNADCEDKLSRELQSIQEELQQKQARKVNTDELKQILLEKESALRKLRTEEERIAKSLNAAQKNVTKLQKALKKMPAGIVVKSDVKASEILKNGTFQISLYPPSFNSTTASWTQRIKCPPVVCVLCRSLISPGAEIRIPECDHPYHVSCVCSSFGVNYLACWVENCESLAPISWVKEFGLHRQIDYDAILERVWTTEESRCFQDTDFMDAVDGEIAGAVAMQLRKKEWVYQLSKDVRSKRIQWLRGTKSRGLSKSFEGNVVFELQPPPHRLGGMQFNQWVESKSGTPIADWKRLWDYQNTDIWIWASRVPMFEVGIHNQCLQGIVLRHQAGSASLIESICRVNSILSIRIRPFDGIFLDCFVQALLAVPWVLEHVTRLVSHGLILIYRTGKIPLDVLLNQINYKLASDFDALSPLWRASKEWHETGSAPDVCSSVTSLEIQAGDIQAWLKFQP